MRKRLLCTDLDRTLIPNGSQPESPRAKALFERIAKRNEVTLVYVTGRHRELIEEAIREYDLPQPAYAIGDVGASIYEVSSKGWYLLPDWEERLQRCWSNANVDELKTRLKAIPALKMQEPEKQGRFKVSYYVDVDNRIEQVMAEVAEHTSQCDPPVNLIWSQDEETGLGLLDILPMPANKLTAIRYVMDRLGFEVHDTLFVGDSGNDMRVFRSVIPSVVVANAEDEIKQCALQADTSPIYVAQGTLPELNGNYRAGIVEGAYHFWPEVHEWIKDN